MFPFIEYLAKLSICLSAVSLFYHFILRKHTFYNWNRWYLLIYSTLSFLLPLIDISPAIRQSEAASSPVILAVPALSHITLEKIIPAENHPFPSQFDPWNLVSFIILAGIVFMTARLCFHFAAYIRIRNSAKLISTDNNVNIYHVAKGILPFSFGNAVFINPDVHKPEELRDIILHEFVHVKQKHSLDNIWCEILCVLNWYNPFAWLIRYSIRQNLEYIADRKVLDNGVNPKQYQYLLLKVIGVPEFRIANQFNFSSLKQRIIMMNKVQTAKIHLIRFLFVMPMLLVLLIVFRKDIETLAAVKQFVRKPDPLFAYKRKSERMLISGMVIDGATGKGIANQTIDLVKGQFGSINQKDILIITLKTDKDGFYFYEDKEERKHEEFIQYKLIPKGEKYKQFLSGGNSFTFEQKFLNGIFGIVFTGERGTKVEVQSYGVSIADVSPDIRPADLKKEFERELVDIKNDYNLGAGFRNKYPYLVPENLITKFGNAYFDQKKEMIGYETQLEFYLDGKKVPYEKINEVFSKVPIEVKNIQMEGKSKYPNNFSAENIRHYSFTFPYSMAPPSKTLLTKNNIEWTNVSTFDLTKLENEAFFLDGFRQENGMGSNMKPAKRDIKRIALFKGDLAKYYDKKLNKVWWIETRPQEEVFERPAF